MCLLVVMIRTNVCRLRDSLHRSSTARSTLVTKPTSLHLAIKSFYSHREIFSTTMETAKNFYNRQYESWVPWAEDKYLAWFGKNKTSYVAEGLFSQACF